MKIIISQSGAAITVHHKYLKDKPYGGTVRVGIGQFNTKEDIRQLIHAVEEIARG